MMDDTDFWSRLDQLVADNPLAIDRPKGTVHPRYPSFTYPLDYGYLAGTCAGDGEGIDVWVGSSPEQGVTGVLCTVDLDQSEAEVKILYGCTAHEAEDILAVHNVGLQSAVLVRRPAVEVPRSSSSKTGEMDNVGDAKGR